MPSSLFSLRALRARSASLTHTLEQAQQAARSLTAKLPTGSLPADFVPSLLARVLPGSAPGLKPGAPATDMQAASFTAKAGTRPYRLFIPRHAAPRPALIVMLHGCTQTPEDFAAGTRMNALACQAGAYVLYPAQLASANAQRCWNWFNPADQQPEGGEAGIIAAMTRSITAEHRIDPAQIFAAGLSAGGAQAAILGATHPEIFSAIGVHSGLACGAARDIPTALAAMRQGHAGQGTYRTRTIIFQGDRDTTVAAANAAALATQFAPAATGPTRTETGTAEGGLTYTRIIRSNQTGRPALEQWIIHGGAHAWSGGSPAGTYTEPAGPDASRAMLSFFLA